jgi:type II secretory pathway component PulK
MSARPRRGFALLAVLWVIAGLSALALGVTLAARQAVAAAHNRNDLTRAQWRAEECAEQARAVIAGALSHGEWRGLDRVVRAASSGRSDCSVSLRASGSRLNVNTIDEETLRALLARLGTPPRRRDSLVDALLDWRDADDVPHALGAERAWYEQRSLLLPRNGPLADIRELRLVRGYEAFGALDSLLDVEPARLSLDQAPLSLLASLPGFGEEAVSRASELRARSLPIGDLVAFAGQLSPNARERLLSGYAELVARTTPEPDAWILTARATTGSPAVTAVLELRLVRGGDRAAIVRRRTWIA